MTLREVSMPAELRSASSDAFSIATSGRLRRSRVAFAAREPVQLESGRHGAGLPARR